MPIQMKKPEVKIMKTCETCIHKGTDWCQTFAWGIQRNGYEDCRGWRGK